MSYHGLSKILRELAKSIPTIKPILQTFEEIGHSIQRSFPLAKSIELRQAVVDAKRKCNKFSADIDSAYGKEITGGFNNPWDKLIDDCSSLNKPKSPPPSGGRSFGGGNNPSNGGGPMLGGGGLGPLWK